MKNLALVTSVLALSFCLFVGSSSFADENVIHTVNAEEVQKELREAKKTIQNQERQIHLLEKRVRSLELGVLCSVDSCGSQQIDPMVFTTPEEANSMLSLLCGEGDGKRLQVTCTPR